MRKAGIEGLEQLRERALDPGGSGRPASPTSGWSSRWPWTQVVDTSEGIEWARWFPGAKTEPRGALPRPLGREQG